MARYIDADALLEQVSKKKSEVGKARYTDGFNDAILRVRSMISSSATADVAPRAEVAREIFEEIDKLHLHVSSPYDANRYAAIKKKYTETEPPKANP